MPLSVIAGVILYGIRSLNESEPPAAWKRRLRFDSMSDGSALDRVQSIDHTTISMFRFTHKELIKELFVQVALIARQVGQLTLDTLGFDETKIKASN